MLIFPSLFRFILTTIHCIMSLFVAELFKASSKRLDEHGNVFTHIMYGNMWRAHTQSFQWANSEKEMMLLAKMLGLWEHIDRFF